MPHRDEEGLTTNLERLLADPLERERQAALAVERCEEFDVSRFTERWSALLDRVASNAA